MSAEEIMELQKKNCIFCKIIAKEIPSNVIYEDEKVSVILDINPANEGHCLVLPKEHYQILPQIPDDLIGYLFVMAKKTSRILLKSLGTKGTTIFVANGAIAGQKAPHFMIHVMSRKPGDMLFELPKTVVDEPILNAAQSKLAAKLGYALKKDVKELEHKPEEEKQKELPENTIEVESEIKEETGIIDESPEDDQEERNHEESNDNEKKDMNLDDIANLFLKQ